MRFTDLFPTLSVKDQGVLAKKAGTSRAYLWQLANRWRGKRPSVGLISRLALADKRLGLDEMVREFASKRPLHRPAKKRARR